MELRGTECRACSMWHFAAAQAGGAAHPRRIGLTGARPGGGGGVQGHRYALSEINRAKPDGAAVPPELRRVPELRRAVLALLQTKINKHKQQQLTDAVS